MSLTSVKAIGNALKLVETKKEKLKKAFDELQSRSSKLSSFNMNWADLDSYFTSLHSELLHKFFTLRALESAGSRKPKPTRPYDPFSSDPVPVELELRALCENMDAVGLRTYIIERPKERAAIRAEMVGAFKHAPDPASLVLDALEDFWDPKAECLARLRTGCTVLLEELLTAGIEIRPEVRARAKALAVDWKAKLDDAHSHSAAVNAEHDNKEGKEEDGGMGSLGYLQLLVTYKLHEDDGGYDKDGLVECVVWSGRYPQTLQLCRTLGLESKISGVVQGLINKGKHLLALKFIFEFKLNDEFPTVPLLKDHVQEIQLNAQKVRKKGKNSRQALNDAAMNEIIALKSVMKFVEEHGLESQFSKDELLTRIGMLEKEKADRKRQPTFPPTVAYKSIQPAAKQPKQFGNKGKRAPAPYPPPPFVNNYNSVGARPYMQNPGMLPPEHAIGPYGMARPVVAADPTANMYGLPVGSMPFPGNAPAAIPGAYSAGPYNSMAGTYDAASQYHNMYYHHPQ